MAKEKILVTQIRSEIGHDQKQRDTLRCLGLGRIGRSAVHESQRSTLGMIQKVAHLVRTEPVEKGK